MDWFSFALGIALGIFFILSVQRAIRPRAQNKEMITDKLDRILSDTKPQTFNQISDRMNLLPEEREILKCLLYEYEEKNILEKVS
ncbi:MAG: hypothetical protein RL292_326, partial [Candidatus Parcubacteria bacterium]